MTKQYNSSCSESTKEQLLINKLKSYFARLGTRNPADYSVSMTFEELKLLLDHIDRQKSDVQRLALDWMAADDQARENWQKYVDCNESRLDAIKCLMRGECNGFDKSDW